MADLTSSNNESKQTVSGNGQDCNKNQEMKTISSHSNTSLNDVRPFVASNEVTGETVSKRKRKRMLKHQQWLQRKEQKKVQRKERIQKAKEEGLPVPKSRSARRKGIKKMDCDEALPVRVVIDMSFEAYMDENSIKKLLKQVKSCYAVNRKASKPVQLYLTGFGGNIQAITEEIYKEYKNWDIHIKNEGYLDVFKRDDIVYLTSDSENVLEDIDLSKAYIIGGLVDHNHHKGLCHRIAVENHVTHAQLPIKNFVKLQSRTVLTVNHGIEQHAVTEVKEIKYSADRQDVKPHAMFDIMLKYLETKDWQRAFYDVIPKRKGVSMVDMDNEGCEEQVGENVVE